MCLDYPSPVLRRLPSVLLAAVALSGCPGSIDDPSPFFAAAATSCPSEYDVEVDLLQRTCGQLGCHTGGPSLAAAGLDLAAANVGDRLLAHTSAECGGRPLVDPSDFHDGSYLLVKVTDPDPPCGERMPAGMPPLNGTQMACLEQYLAELAGVSLDQDGAVPDVDAGPPPLMDDAGPPGDAGPPTDAGPPLDGGPPPTPEAVTYQAEAMTLTTYEVDAADTTLIRLPDGATTGSASVAFDGVPASYSLIVHAVAEADGQPTLRIHVAGALVATETYPLASGAANEPITFGPYSVTLAAGDEILLEGDANASAWARVDSVEVTP